MPDSDHQSREMLLWDPENLDENDPKNIDSRMFNTCAMTVVSRSLSLSCVAFNIDR